MAHGSKPGASVNSWFNYMRQQSWFQYPVTTAMKKRLISSGNDTGAFRTVQDALQFDAGGELWNSDL